MTETICETVEVSNRKQVTNWMWIVVGLLLGNSPALSQIATYLPMKTEAESRVTLVRRWLKNFRVDVWAFYQPILAQVFKGWQAVDAFIILDGVMVFGDRWQIFRLSLQHGCRAIPLAWVVIEGQGVTQVDKLEDMLTRVAKFLRPRVKRVTFLADRGFRDCDWAQMCLKLQWNYGIRVTRNTFVTLEDGDARRIDQLGV
ncbi:MAG: transposase, partial [Chloroflexi bacterium]|nr:transposase [Chloroflexota bacterium]